MFFLVNYIFFITLKVSLPKDEVWEAEETEETTEENADTQFAMVSRLYWSVNHYSCQFIYW